MWLFKRRKRVAQLLWGEGWSLLKGRERRVLLLSQGRERVALLLSKGKERAVELLSTARGRVVVLMTKGREIAVVLLPRGGGRSPGVRGRRRGLDTRWEDEGTWGWKERVLGLLRMGKENLLGKRGAKEKQLLLCPPPLLRLICVRGRRWWRHHRKVVLPSLCQEVLSHLCKERVVLLLQKRTGRPLLQRLLQGAA